MPWTPGARTEMIENDDVRILYSKLDKQRNIFEDDTDPLSADQAVDRGSQGTLSPLNADIERGIDALDQAIEGEASKLRR